MSVPFTRGRDRSHASASIVEECTKLIFNKTASTRFVLLAQNVNSYCHDQSEEAILANPSTRYETSSDAFSNTYCTRGGARHYFSDLVCHGGCGEWSRLGLERFNTTHTHTQPCKISAAKTLAPTLLSEESGFSRFLVAQTMPRPIPHEKKLCTLWLSSGPVIPVLNKGKRS